MSEGSVIYQGPIAEIKSYFELNFNYQFPKYTNSSDLLLKLAEAPNFVSPYFSKELLIKTSEISYQKKIQT